MIGTVLLRQYRSLWVKTFVSADDRPTGNGGICNYIAIPVAESVNPLKLLRVESPVTAGNRPTGNWSCVVLEIGSVTVYFSVEVVESSEVYDYLPSSLNVVLS